MGRASTAIGLALCVSLTSALQVCRLGGISAISAAALPSRRAFVTAQQPDETPEERRARLEALGREAAAEAARLDSAAGDDALMAEFNKRLDQEGGATMFKAKTAVSGVGETASDSAQKAKRVAEDAVDSATSWTNTLTEQQRKIGTIVLGLVAFNIVIGLISSAFR